MIDADSGSLAQTLREAWASRRLVLLLVERDLKVRYRQAALGVAWAILTPLAFTVVLTIVFGLMARLGPEGIAYAPFLLTGLLAWNYFNYAVGRCSTALMSGSSLLSRVWFPRLLLPVTHLVTPAVDLFFGLLVLLGLLAWYGVAPTWHVLLLPAYFGLAVAMSFGTGALLGALNAYYRDVRHFLPVLLRLWFFCTPIIYGLERVPEPWRPVFAVNPMVSVVAGFRAGLLGLEPPTPAMVLTSCVAAAVTCVAGLFVFHRLEKTVADVV